MTYLITNSLIFFLDAGVISGKFLKHGVIIISSGSYSKRVDCIYERNKHWGKFLLKGPEAAAFVQRFCPLYY